MRLLALAAPALLSGPAAACSVCFGGKDSNPGLFDGIWWGIVLLVTVTFSMVGGIGWLLYKVESRRLAEEARG